MIIDAAQALFVTYNNCSIMQFCDIAITSFFADKVVGCGEGGAVLVRDPPWQTKLGCYAIRVGLPPVPLSTLLLV